MGLGRQQCGAIRDGRFQELDEAARLELSSVVSVAAGAWHTVALDKTGQVWAWGGNTLGQLGSGKSGKFSVSATPQKIEDLDNVVAISSGDYHVLALRADGSVWAWGGNEQGQLGDGKLAPRDRPYPVAGLEKIRLISSSNNASQAEGINGQVWAWGGRLGANEPWLTPRMLEGGLPIENATAFSISGRVTADGKPVAGATVSVDVDACGKTDTYGSYRCLLPAGFEGLLQAQKDGFVFTPGKISAVSSPLTGQNIHGNAKVAKSLPGLAMELKALKQNTITPPVAAPKAIPTLHLDESEQIREKDAIRLPPTPITEVHPKIAAPAPEARPRTVETSILKKEEPQAVIWHIGGAVHLSGFGAEGQPIVGVEISGQGAQCGKTDSGGEYVCAVPSGWTGHLAATKRNYRFSPSTLSFRDVREDHPFQDFKAVFEPD